LAGRTSASRRSGSLRPSCIAAHLVSQEPLDQAGQELLIRCLTRAGRRRAAETQLAECEALLRRELGVEPGPELRRAAGQTDGIAAGAVGDSDAALGQLEAGQAALDAGAVEPGVQILRQACAEAVASDDVSLQARTLAALGSALVHAVRGRDEEGAVHLHEALRLAEACGERSIAAAACRELGYIDVQAGRAPSAGRWLTKATDLAEGNDELCAVLGVRGMALSDRAHYGAALDLLNKSVARAERCGRRRQAALSLSLIGRVHMLRGDLSLALPPLDESLALVAAERWTAFRPWPEALRAEASLLMGRPDQAAERLDHAFRLACQLGDPCWEAMGARLTGLLTAAAGNPVKAREQLADAMARATRVSDAYAWVHAHVLDSSAAIAVETGAQDAVESVDDLAGRPTAVLSSAGARELTPRRRSSPRYLSSPLSCRISPTVSVRPRCSTIFPSRTRTRSTPTTSTRRPVAGSPSSSPVWVPLIVVATAARSPSTISSSIVTSTSGIPSRNMAKKQRTPSTPPGNPGGLV